jgi:hypothetical protein
VNRSTITLHKTNAAAKFYIIATNMNQTKRLQSEHSTLHQRLARRHLWPRQQRRIEAARFVPSMRFPSKFLLTQQRGWKAACCLPVSLFAINGRLCPVSRPSGSSLPGSREGGENRCRLGGPSRRPPLQRHPQQCLACRPFCPRRRIVRFAEAPQSFGFGCHLAC